jgi:hypothetical protein
MEASCLLARHGPLHEEPPAVPIDVSFVESERFPATESRHQRKTDELNPPRSYGLRGGYEHRHFALPEPLQITLARFFPRLLADHVPEIDRGIWTCVVMHGDLPLIELRQRAPDLFDASQ